MEHILIIDNDTSTAEMERDYLEINSYEVTIEKSGVSGFQRALQEDIRLVLTELDLEDLNGFELCRELRNRRDIPIIIVSNRTDEIDKVRGLGVGADDYVTKPFSPNELIARVKANLSQYDRLTRKRIQKNDCIVLDQFRIDRTARRVTVAGQEIAFTTKDLLQGGAVPGSLGDAFGRRCSDGHGTYQEDPAEAGKVCRCGEPHRDCVGSRIPFSAVGGSQSK